MEPSMEKIKIAHTKTISWTTNLTGHVIPNLSKTGWFFNEQLKELFAWLTLKIN